MIYWISAIILKIFSRLYLRGTVIGRENFPKKGPCICVVNHNSNMDVIAMAMAVKSRVHTMAKIELFQVPVLKWWLRAVSMFPVVRDSADSEAFNYAIDLLKKGEILFIAPEGTRKKENGQRNRPRTGFVRMVQSVACPVVPAAIYGTDRVLKPGAWFPKPVKIAVKVGKPIMLDKIEINKERKELLQQQANDVMNIIYAMWDELDQRYHAK